MENIIEPSDAFDFSLLSLAHPIGIQGGAYFTKIEYMKKPLYIQTAKSLTRQGIVKSGKKFYVDLMFDKNAETLINWFEHLEEKCKQLIYGKREAWFQGSLEESDIENAFNPLIRVYKSGKFYLVRAFIKSTKEDTPALPIYDERERSLQASDLQTDTEMISIIEIQGIKFTTRNFQVEIELRQLMVLDKEPAFEGCMIKPVRREKPAEPVVLAPEVSSAPVCNFDSTSEMGSTSTTIIPEFKEPKNVNVDVDMDMDMDILEEVPPAPVKDALNIEFEELSDEIQEKDDELEEVTDFAMDTSEAIPLKKPNQVYFELYKEARKKAKEAKKNAILAFLEAKNIKKTYMIETMEDSDSDIDAEIDDVSESELEGL